MVPAEAAVAAFLFGCSLRLSLPRLRFFSDIVLGIGKIQDLRLRWSSSIEAD